jgi:hypothetical protein
VTAAGLGLAGLATAEQAQAVACQSHSYQYLSDDSAGMAINVDRDCSDGRSRVYGTISDLKCDARSAFGTIYFFNGSNSVWYRKEWPEATNGCHTSSTFNWLSTNNSPRVLAEVYAGNHGPTQSSGASAWV